MKLSSVILVCLGLLTTIATFRWASSLMLITNSNSNAAGIKHLSITTGLSQQPSSLSVAEIARLVTVRILTEPGSGSGVIIHRQGQTYTVLTCEHVIGDSQGGKYTVLTVDGITQPARRKSISHIENTDEVQAGSAVARRSTLDLALVQFESKKLYRVAALGDSDALSPGNPVYASGFPNYQFLSQKSVEDTRNWGTRAFRSTKGEVSLLLERSLPEGYRLGYTNDVEQGMSGGPVLNERGQLVGINGRLKYPLQGIDVFTFADGTKPSVEMFQQMEALSWAIPIATFQQKTKLNLTQPLSNP